MNPSRRALLASFLAAPVAVRMGRWVKPAPVVSDAEFVSLMMAEHDACLRAGFAAMIAEYHRQREEVTLQFLEASVA